MQRPGLLLALLVCFARLAACSPPRVINATYFARNASIYNTEAELVRLSIVDICSFIQNIYVIYRIYRCASCVARLPRFAFRRFRFNLPRNQNPFPNVLLPFAPTLINSEYIFRALFPAIQCDLFEHATVRTNTQGSVLVDFPPPSAPLFRPLLADISLPSNHMYFTMAVVFVRVWSTAVGPS